MRTHTPPTPKVPKVTQTLSREEMKKLLSVARGEVPPDILIENVELLDLVNGGTSITHVAICGRWIAGVGLDYAYTDTGAAGSMEKIDGKGLTIVPGFIDGHVHLESSMMHPFEFERLTLPLGTTTLVCDPHEITNVMGAKGFSWILRSAELMEQNLFVQVSSCVPSLPGLETQGGIFNLEEMLTFRDHPHVMGLAEMMNYPGVVKGDDSVLDKIAAFADAGMNLDGHCPMVRGKALNAYIAAGIQNCHETITKDEGMEKLAKGMSLILREGSVAKNLNNLAPLVSEFNSPQCFLCTDDRNPYEIFKEGHVNYMVWKLINESNLPPHVAYRLSSFSAAKHFGMKRLGLIAPGYQADFILLKDVREVKISTVFMKGKKVRPEELQKNVGKKLQASLPPLENTMKRKLLTERDLSFKLEAGIYNVIEIIPDELVTRHLRLLHDGSNFTKGEKDVLRMAVIERYGHALPPSLGLVKGMGLSDGALASSVAHDSHNIIVIGVNEKDMILAVNALIEQGGGFCVVQNNKVQSLLPLPVAGLISLKTAAEIAEGIEDLRTKLKKLEVTLKEPFLQMAFLALPVIPALKLTDRGLVNVDKFEFVSLREGDR